MAEAQWITKPVPFDEVFNSEHKPDNPKTDNPAYYENAPKPDAKWIDKPVSFDEVFKSVQAENKKREEAAKPKPPKGLIETVGQNAQTALYERENKYLANQQSTSPYPRDYKKRLGEGVMVQRDEDVTFDKDGNPVPAEPAWHFRSESGETIPTNSKKHVVLRDTETGKYHVYERGEDTDYGPIKNFFSGMASHVQEGFQAAPTRLPSTAGAATRGQEALRAQQAVEDTTGAHVPVPQNMVTDSGMARRTAAMIEALPGGSTPFEQSAARMDQALGEAAARATGGTAPTAEAAGATARGAIENYAKPKEGVLARRVSDAYDKVDAHVPSDASGELKNTQKIAQDLQTRFEATKGESGTNKINPTLDAVLSAATDPKGVTYQGLKDLRTRVGEMLEQGANIAETGVSDKELRALYKGLTDDMRAMVSEHGGTRGLQLWERANNLARLASERRENLGKILGTNRSDEGIFGRIMALAGSTNSADAKTLAQAKKSMPADEWSEVAQAAVGRLGKVRTENGTVFDPGKFVTDYDKLSDRGKSLLFGDNQRLRKALDSISELAQFREPVGHPGPIAHLVSAGIVLNHAHQGEGMAGKMGQLLHVLGGVFSMRAVGNMLSKPATAESVAKWMEAYKVMTLKPTKGSVSLYQRATETLASDAGKNDRENIGAGLKHGYNALLKLSSYLPFGKS